MCGIVGKIQLTPTAQACTEADIAVMSEAITHRGPDDSGSYLAPKGRAGLGFRRLAIIDLSKAGHQPMTNEDGTLWIVFNGEIYNYVSLREELLTKGHAFSSKTDTEVLLHGFEEWGADLLNRIQGMFSFAIWNEKTNELFFARDHIGVKPFYYTTQGNTFLFASEIKAILRDELVPRKVCEEALSHYLTLFAAPAPLTLFDGIYKLPAGHAGWIRSTGELTTYQYWDAIGTIDTFPSEQDWIAEIRQKLRASVEKRLVADVPFGAYLSGGVDSSLTAALMQDLRKEVPLKTFTIGFADNPDQNELEHARKVVRDFKLDGYEILTDKHALMQDMARMVYHQDEPLADWVCFPLLKLSEFIREKGVIVAQVGEGADELFAGYGSTLDFIKAAPYFHFLSNLPRPLRWVAFQLGSLAGALLQKPLLTELFRRALEREELFWGGAIAFGEYEKRKLLKNTPTTRPTYRYVQEVLAKFDNANPSRPLLERITYLEFKHRLPDLLLTRVDKMSMAASIEAREPFLDLDLVKRGLQIPSGLNIRNGTKSLLKQAARGIIPDSIIDRPKMGFLAPIAQWLKEDDFHNWAKEQVLGSQFLESGYLDVRYITRLFELHKSGRRNCSIQIWTILNLTSWYDCYFTNQK